MKKYRLKHLVKLNGILVVLFSQIAFFNINADDKTAIGANDFIKSLQKISEEKVGCVFGETYANKLDGTKKTAALGELKKASEIFALFRSFLENENVLKGDLSSLSDKEKLEIIRLLIILENKFVNADEIGSGNIIMVYFLSLMKQTLTFSLLINSPQTLKELNELFDKPEREFAPDKLKKMFETEYAVDFKDVHPVSSFETVLKVLDKDDQFVKSKKSTVTDTQNARNYLLRQLQGKIDLRIFNYNFMLKFLPLSYLSPIIFERERTNLITLVTIRVKNFEAVYKKDTAEFYKQYLKNINRFQIDILQDANQEDKKDTDINDIINRNIGDYKTDGNFCAKHKNKEMFRSLEMNLRPLSENPSRDKKTGK